MKSSDRLWHLGGHAMANTYTYTYMNRINERKQVYLDASQTRDYVTAIENHHKALQDQMKWYEYGSIKYLSIDYEALLAYDSHIRHWGIMETFLGIPHWFDEHLLTCPRVYWMQHSDEIVNVSMLLSNSAANAKVKLKKARGDDSLLDSSDAIDDSDDSDSDTCLLLLPAQPFGDGPKCNERIANWRQIRCMIKNTNAFFTCYHDLS